MKELPILFSASMVRAILASTKSVTRRTVHERMYLVVDGDEDTGRVVEQSDPDFGVLATEHARCPYGGPGDRLWVKETWRPTCVAGAGVHVVSYAADEENRTFHPDQIDADWTMPKAAARGNVSPLYLPRWASRVLLEVISVRVERLQDLTEEDARAEGVTRDGLVTNGQPYRTAFARLWDEINGKKACWSSNPHVWRVEFRRVAP